MFIHRAMQILLESDLDLHTARSEVLPLVTQKLNRVRFRSPCHVFLCHVFRRSVMGWIGDRRFVNRLVLFGAAAAAAGVATCASALLSQFWMLAVYSFVFGVLAGTEVVFFWKFISDSLSVFSGSFRT